jgi:hypothetical protein
MPGRFEEPPGVIDGPGLAPARCLDSRRCVILTAATGFRAIVSSSTAQVRATRSVSRASLRHSRAVAAAPARLASRPVGWRESRKLRAAMGNPEFRIRSSWFCS